MDKQTILGAFGFYQAAPAADRVVIAAAAERIELGRGAYVYHEGEVCRQFIAVGAGSLRIMKTGETGREITLYHVQDAESCLVNALSVLLERPAVATARADYRTEAVLLPARSVREWARNRDWMRAYAIETMADRLLDVMTLIEEVVFGRIESRLAALLLERFRGGGVLGATHEELAGELGTAREVVSRVLKELEREGAIRLGRARVEMRDEALLLERSEQP